MLIFSLKSKLELRIAGLEEELKDKEHFADDLIDHAGDLEKERDNLKEEIRRLKDERK